MSGSATFIKRSTSGISLADLFDPEPDDREVYVWAAIDSHTYELIHVEASPGRSEFDSLLFLRTVLERC
ncbi:hypothetical protein [Natrinema halophilum]|uniref:hypothetical protein n=1 Tax=Natrinema halophilum TaxID=1699371 RepID=UPI001F416035|nr:hypothetical protein [Natrinema halophilum]UHQ96221.1 hypothetical protein HYG82_23255 [Natrinema halophilum]